MHPVPVDTNILARLATGDVKTEHAAARKLFAGPVLILATVLLELEWVLRSVYGYSPAQFLAFTQWLSASANVHFEHSETMHEALRLHELGFDYADALHLAAAKGQPLATFDKALLRRARKHGIAVRAL
jgi:predicted nucleic acid-binding protein